MAARLYLPGKSLEKPYLKNRTSLRAQTRRHWHWRGFPTQLSQIPLQWRSWPPRITHVLRASIHVFYFQSLNMSKHSRVTRNWEAFDMKNNDENKWTKRNLEETGQARKRKTSKSNITNILIQFKGVITKSMKYKLLLLKWFIPREEKNENFKKLIEIKNSAEGLKDKVR